MKCSIMQKSEKRNWIKLGILMLLLSSYFQLPGQEILDTKYYTDVYRFKEVKRKRKAQYVEVIRKFDETTNAIEFKRIADDFLLESGYYKNNLPYGVWKVYDKETEAYRELDYSFTVSYSNEVVPDELYVSLKNNKTFPELAGANEFTPPTLKNKANPILKIHQSIHYPSFAWNNGMEGLVKIHIKIDKTGHLEVLAVNRGREPHMDAEAVRVLKECQNWNPAVLNGEKIDVYSIVSVYFVLR